MFKKGQRFKLLPLFAIDSPDFSRDYQMLPGMIYKAQANGDETKEYSLLHVLYGKNQTPGQVHMKYFKKVSKPTIIIED